MSDTVDKIPLSQLGLLTSYVGVSFLATYSVYSASFTTLKKPREATERASGAPIRPPSDESVITSRDAYWMPILGSAALLSLWLAIKYCSMDWINYFLSFYFSIVGSVMLFKVGGPIMERLIGKDRWDRLSTYRITISEDGVDANISFPIKSPHLLVAVFALLPPLLYLTADRPKPYIVSNIIALAFVRSTFLIFKLDGFKTGCIMLSGLFLYDVWFVFGTNVMVDVATKLDAPIKIMFPKSVTLSTSSGFTLLGLGDIIIPGSFIALSLRYDHYRSGLKATFPKPYFKAGLIAYVLGLVLTIFVMHFFHHAQPALFYLSPGAIIAFVFTAWQRGELRSAWRWTDGDENPPPPPPPPPPPSPIQVGVPPDDDRGEGGSRSRPRDVERQESIPSVRYKGRYDE